MPETAQKLRKVIQPRDDQGNPIGPPSVFEADTPEELAEKIAESYGRLSSHLRETKRAELQANETPDPETPILQFRPRDLTADETWALKQQLDNPTTLRAGLRRIIEAEFGAPIEQIRNSLTETEIKKRIDESNIAAEDFMGRHPEFRRCQENHVAMRDYLKEHKMGWTAKNLEIAFAKLNGAGMLLLNTAPVVPTNPEGESARNVGLRRSASTGLSGRGSSVPAGTARPETTKGPTPAEIEKMPSAEFGRRLNSDPAFKAHVEALMRSGKLQ